MITEEYEKIINHFGNPFVESHGWKINEYSLLKLFILEHVYHYHANRKFFEKYNQANGMWEKMEPEKVEQELFDFAWKTGLLYVDKEALGILLKYSNILSLLERLRIMVVYTPHDNPAMFIHAENGLLVDKDGTGNFQMQSFSPEADSRNMIRFQYDPSATCPRFVNGLIRPMLEHEDCLQIIQLYFGQCLLKRNISQTLLILSGPAGVGKSVLVSIIEKILGTENVSELHPAMLDNRFELSEYAGKSLLTAKDVPNDSLSGNKINALKSMTGKDRLAAERKYQNERVYVEGNFNIIITGNGDITLNFGNDRDAWERRVLWVPCRKPKNFKRINDFDDFLIKEEGPGILAWAVEGARMLLQAGGHIRKSGTQQSLVKYLLNESVPVDDFVKQCVKEANDKVITSEEALRCFWQYVKYMKWNNVNITATKFYRDFKIAMLRYHPECRETTNIPVQDSRKRIRGYHGCYVVLPKKL